MIPRGGRISKFRDDRLPKLRLGHSFWGGFRKVQEQLTDKPLQIPTREFNFINAQNSNKTTIDVSLHSGQSSTHPSTPLCLRPPPQTKDQTETQNGRLNSGRADSPTAAPAPEVPHTNSKIRHRTWLQPERRPLTAIKSKVRQTKTNKNPGTTNQNPRMEKTSSPPGRHAAGPLRTATLR